MLRPRVSAGCGAEQEIEGPETRSRCQIIEGSTSKATGQLSETYAFVIIELGEDVTTQSNRITLLPDSRPNQIN